MKINSRSLIGAGLIFLGSLLGQGQAKAVDFNTSITYRDKYITPEGLMGIDNPVVQTSIDAITDNFTLNIWHQYDLKKGKNSETDLTLKTRPIRLTEKLSLSAGAQIWGSYEYGQEGVGFLTVNYNSFLDLSSTWKNVFDYGFSSRLDLSASKTFDIESISISPKIRTSLIGKDYYDMQRGFAYVTPSINIGTTFLGIKLDSGIEFQKGINKKDCKDDTTAYVGISKRF